MTCTLKKLPKGLLEVTCAVPHDAIKPQLEKAAQELTEQKPLPGYRPGKAPFDAVVARFGAMAVYEAALPAIIRKHYVTAVVDAKAHVYGEPTINVTKLAPDNPVEFTATVAVVPSVVTLADYKKIKVTPKEPKVEETKIDETLKELQRMQTKEVAADREVRSGDKIVVDMDLSRDGVPLDGGQARDHGIFLDEDYYVPGLRDKVLGMKVGEKREFDLKFPENHYQKNLAGTDVHFAVTLKEVHELQHPPIDDELAKIVGSESLAKLRDLIRENMMTEARQKEDQRIEIEILDGLVAKSTFEDVPEKILNDEIGRMIDELKRGVAERGITFEDYLLNVKKSIDELRLEFSGQAVKRIQTAILIRDIGDKEKLEVSDEELLPEIEQLMNRYANDPESQAKVREEDYQDYVRSSLRNRKVLAMLRASATGK